MVDAKQALDRLRGGNARFLADTRSIASAARQLDRATHARGQTPFAIILSCSDSRVPPELAFDQGVGDLFVVRVAGNVVDPALVGSVEFAAATFGSRLVVVLGHSACGAVKATLDVCRGGARPGENIADIVDRIRPSAQAVLDAADDPEDAGIVARAVRANVRTSVDHLRTQSSVLAGLAASDGLVVVGAEYDLETGEVDFFDAPAP